MNVTPVDENENKLGEGLFYEDETDTIWAVDILGQFILQYGLKDGSYKQWPVPHQFPSLVIPVRRGPGADPDPASKKRQFVVACLKTLYLWSPDDADQGSAFHRLCGIEDLEPENVRFNDGKCDAKGRLWVGTMSLEDKPDKGHLYCLRWNDQQQAVLEKQIPCSLSNGLGWTKAGDRFFYVDTVTKSMQVFSYDMDAGKLKGDGPLGRVDFAKLGLPGVPDGLTVDSADNVWISFWDGGQVVEIETAGGPAASIDQYTVGRKLAVPVIRPTTSVFVDHVLYISTSGGPLFKTSDRLNTTAGSPCFCFDLLKKQ